MRYKSQFIVYACVIALHSRAAEAQHAHDGAAVTPAERATAFPDLGGMHAHDAMLESPFNHFVRLDELEAQDAEDDIFKWDLDAWFGRELDRLWLRSEGERSDGATETADLELLWGRSFTPWWTLVAGARADLDPGPERTWAAIGIQGLSPYRFEIETTAYLGEGGDTAARVEARCEVLFTNRLILQPLIELDWYGQDDAATGIGSGLARGELGLRLRYEIRREIAPYVGIVHAKSFGATADYARASGRDADDTRLVTGIRLWF
jgi:copper resistance protein B